MPEAGAGAVLHGRGQFDFYGDKLLTTGNPEVDRDRADEQARPVAAVICG